TLAATARFGEGRTAQVRVDPRAEDSRIERLGDVVVCSNFEANHLVHLCATAGQHHHRAVDALAPQLADDLGPADVGQYPVDQDQVRLRAAAKLDGLPARTRLHP